MKRQSRYDLLNQPSQESWLTSYSDLMTILLVFFVLLISTNHVSAIKFERIKEALKGNTEDTISLAMIQKRIVNLIEQSAIDQYVQLEAKDDSIEIRFAGHLLFDSGRAELKTNSREMLTSFSETLRDLPNYARIAIEGYTDDNPIHDQHFRSNWHLSASRSLAVMEFLDEQGICRKNCEIRGYGEYRPLLPNRDAEGKVIAENQMQNRRVLIRIY